MTLSIPSIKNVIALVNMFQNQRHRIPPMPSPEQLQMFHSAFKWLFTHVQYSSLNEFHANFTDAILQSVVDTFGTAHDAHSTPPLVQNTINKLSSFLKSNPTWWHHASHIQSVSILRPTIRDTWELIDLENRIRVAPISTSTYNT